MKYFKPEEFACKCCGATVYDIWLVELLDNVRERFGKPMIITSGYRCPTHNGLVGGKPNSAHTKGVAVDIACDNSVDRFNLIRLFIDEGVDRIGIAKDFIHVDVDGTKPHPVMWMY